MAKKSYGKQKGDNGRRDTILIVGGFAILGAAVVLLLFGSGVFGGGGENTAVLTQVPALNQNSGNEDSAAGAVTMPAVGEPARDFTAAVLDGDTVRLSDLRGQPVIINFWATWCPPCRMEMPDFQEAYEAHADDNLEILAVNYLEPPDKVRAFFYEEMGFEYTPILDESGEVAELYGVFNFPSTVVVDANGVVTAVHRGYLAREQLEAYLDQTIQ